MGARVLPQDPTASPTPSTTTTTTEAPYRISRQELFGILQRNSIGIGRLFRREYDSAMQVGHGRIALAVEGVGYKY